MTDKCERCRSYLFCLSAAEVNEEDFETMVNKKNCRVKIFTNGDLFRAMSDEEQQKIVRGFFEVEDFADWLKQPISDGK